MTSQGNGSSARDRALNYFHKEKYHCAETVFLAVCEELGYDPWPHITMLTPFGAGIASTQTLCGVISGGLAAIGLALGRKDSSGDRKLPESVAKEFIAHMEQIHGTTTCRTLTGVDFSDPAQREAFHKPDSPRATVCDPLVLEAVTFLAELIRKHSDKMNRYNN